MHSQPNFAKVDSLVQEANVVKPMVAAALDDSISEDSFNSMCSLEQSIFSDNESYMSAGRRNTLRSLNTDYQQKSGTDAKS